MLTYLYSGLEGFRKEFSRQSTWLLFVMVILGFMGSNEMMGVTSFCRFWLMDDCGYASLINFFHSTAWTLSSLMRHWFTFVISQKCALVSQGYIVTFGDHTYVPREGRRMPGVVTLHQNSETQSKPSYFKGQCWGALALCIESFVNPFALPLKLEMHQGFTHLGEDIAKDTLSMTQQMVMMAIKFSLCVNRPTLLILDAYFSVGPVFLLANSIWLVSIKGPAVEIIVRAKKNYVAYLPVDPSDYIGIGRPNKYGEEIHLIEVFDHLHLFQKVPACIYGKIEEIYLTQMNLMWKPTQGLICFVFALTSHGPIVLMCSNLQQDPVAAIELYCLRIRIEVMFDMLKHLIHGFSCHFWSKKMPRHTRKPRKNSELMSPNENDIQTVQSCWDAMERFVNLGGIALGMLQLISLHFTKNIWNSFVGYLRTRSRDIPSERTTKSVMSNLIIRDFLKVAPTGTMQLIRKYILKGKIEAKMFSENLNEYREAG